MDLKNILLAITGLLFLMIAPAALAWIPNFSNMPAEQTKPVQPFELSQRSIVLAQNNEARTAEKGAQSANEDTDQAPDSKPADSEKSGNNSDDAATSPIKPFKPSEEIAAEQAVDFPVDI